MTVYCLNTLLASSSRQLLVLIMEYRDTPFSHRAMDKHLEHAYSALVYWVTHTAKFLPKPQAGRQHHFFTPGCATPFLCLVYSFQRSCVLRTVFLNVETQLWEDKWFVPWALSGRSLCQMAINGWDGNLQSSTHFQKGRWKLNVMTFSSSIPESVFDILIDKPFKNQYI